MFKKTMELTLEERKLIFNAIRYWQMYKSAYDGKEYQLCQKILNSLYDDIYTQKKEQIT